MSAEDELKSLVAGISGFSSWGHAERIRFFAWVQHGIRKKDRFGTVDINWCYSNLSLNKTNTSQYLSEMERRKELLKNGQGYCLEGGLRAKYDAQYGEHDITLSVRQMVAELPDKVPDVAEKDFMKEAFICLRHDAARAAIIMVWNVAYYHLCQYILKHKLNEFNATYRTRYPNKWRDAKIQVLAKYEDFSVDLKESEVIEICKSAQIITNDIQKILVEKLGKRNSAAHPSTVHVTQVQAEAYIDDLIRNVVLQLSV
jgi:hypothetical protein